MQELQETYNKICIAWNSVVIKIPELQFCVECNWNPLDV